MFQTRGTDVQRPWGRDTSALLCPRNSTEVLVAAAECGGVADEVIEVGAEGWTAWSASQDRMLTVNERVSLPTDIFAYD